MSDTSLEARVTALERTVADVQRRLAAPPARPGDIMAVAGILRDDPEFAEWMEFNRYYRHTGQEPPPDWKPGDPIPDPDWWGDETP